VHVVPGLIGCEISDIFEIGERVRMVGVGSLKYSARTLLEEVAVEAAA
jgi:hypothetical protein